MNKLLSIQEVASILGVSTKTLRRWEERGIFVPLQRTPGNQRRYSQEQIDIFKRQRSGEQVPQTEKNLSSTELLQKYLGQEKATQYQSFPGQQSTHPAYYLAEVVKSIIVFKKI